MLLHRTTDARTFNQWQEVNRHVQKGERAFYILAPTHVKRLVEKQLKDERTGQNQITQTEEILLVGFHGIPVFAYEQTQGEPLPEYAPKALPPLIEIARKWNIKVNYDLLAGAWGRYSPEKNEITLATEDATTFFHELAHAGHGKIENLKHGQDPEQETIAQLTAVVLARLYGQDSDAYSWNYIANYAGDHRPEAVGRLCFKVLAKVQKILQLILSETTEQTVTPPISVPPFLGAIDERKNHHVGSRL